MSKPQRAPQRAPAKTWQRSSLTVDRFHVDPSRIPDGMSYQWIAKTVMGQENVREMVNMQRNYWVPVPASRHPEIFGVDVEGPGLMDGMLLVERPKEITDEAQEEDRNNARTQLGDQLTRLDQIPQGTFPRKTGTGAPAVSVQRGQDLSIPEDAEVE